MRYRKNVKNLSADEKTAFVNAVLALKKQASALHPQDASLSRYDDYAEVHMNAMMAMPGWAHTAPAFFPWHRVLILAFENDLAAIDSSVTLPYWDWTDAASNPLTSDFLGTNGDPQQDRKVTDGPFAFDGPSHWTLKVNDEPTDPEYLQRDFAEAQNQALALPTGAQVSAVLDPQPPAPHQPYERSPYKNNDGSFRAAVEYQLHNLVHRWVGGTMLRMTSPNDPVFFLHHCNIDRLWWMWQTVHPADAPYLPVSGAAAGHNLNDELIFSVGGPAPFPDSYRPADVLDNLSLGYTYEAAAARAHIPRSTFAVARILFGIVNDAPGAWIDGQGHIHHGGGGPGDPVLHRESKEAFDGLVGHAITELAGLIAHTKTKADIKAAAAPLLPRSKL